MRVWGFGRAVAATIVTCVSLGVVGPANAATFNAYALLGGAGCEESSSGSTAQVAACVNVDGGGPIFGSYAEAGLGTLRTAATATLQRDPTTGTLLVNSSTVRARAIFNDTLNFGIDSGTFELSVDLLGKLNVAGSLTNGGGSAIGLLSYSLTSQGTLINPQQNYAFSAFGDIFGSPGVVSNLDTYVFNFDGGRLGLNGFMQSDASCGISNDCFVESIFENSLRFIGGVVRDTNGNVVDGGFLGSSSGFDYSKGVKPHNFVAAVPLPAGGWLLLAGLGGLAALRRRTSR